MAVVVPEEDEEEEEDREEEEAPRRRKLTPERSAQLVDVLVFRRMVVPVIIQIIFWLGAGLSVLVSLYQIFSGIKERNGGGLDVALGVLGLILGPLSWRIFCELLIVVFRINETLTDIKNELKRKAD